MLRIQIRRMTDSSRQLLICKSGLANMEMNQPLETLTLLPILPLCIQGSSCLLLLCISLEASLVDNCKMNTLAKWTKLSPSSVLQLIEFARASLTFLNKWEVIFWCVNCGSKALGCVYSSLRERDRKRARVLETKWPSKSPASQRHLNSCLSDSKE